MNAQYKQADRHSKHKEFVEGKLVMVRINKQRLPSSGCPKLQNKKYGPFLVVKKINNNSNIIGLPQD